MAASFPSSVKSFTPKTDGPGNTVLGAHVNDLQDEVTAVEGTLLNGVSYDLKPSTAGGRTLGTSALPWSHAYAKTLILTPDTELTIASGAITVTQGVHTVDTEGDASSDDLDTVTAGTGITEGAVLVLRAENTARVVTAKDGTGNLVLNGDFILSATDRTLTLLYDGTNWVELARSVQVVNRVLDRDVAVATVASTTDETTVYTYTVPGGTLSTNKKLRLSVLADHLNNDGAARNLTVKVKYGTTTLFSTGAMSITNSATRRGILLSLDLAAFASESAQVAGGSLVWTADATGVATTVATSLYYGHHNNSTEDSSGDLALAVTVQHGTSSANISFRCLTAHLEVLE